MVSGDEDVLSYAVRGGMRMCWGDVDVPSYTDINIVSERWGG